MNYREVKRIIKMLHFESCIIEGSGLVTKDAPVVGSRATVQALILTWPKYLDWFEEW